MASGEYFVPRERVLLLVYGGINGSTPTFLNAADQAIYIVPMWGNATFIFLSLLVNSFCLSFS